MQLKYILILLFLLLNEFVYAQRIIVVDKTSLDPIDKVFIHNKKLLHTAVTNAKGIANVSSFSLNDTLFFQHHSYKQYYLPYSEIKKDKFIIKLEESVVKLGEVVISANRWEESRREIPNHITKISRKQIDFSNPQTSADLLAINSNVFVQKSQLGGGSPMIRGFSANRVLIVVDGTRMNNAIFRSGNLQNVISIDVNNVESSEVIFGPGSVIYGSDALGGVMDFHTLTPHFTDNDSTSYLSVKAMTRYASANHEKSGHVDFNIGTRNLSFLTSVSYSDFGDLQMGSRKHQDYQRPEYVSRIAGKDSIVKNTNANIQRFSGYSQFGVLQKIRAKINRNNDFTYALHYSELSDVPRYDRLIQYSDEKLKYAEWYYGPQKWLMNSFSLVNFNKTKFSDKIKINAAFQNYEESRNDRKLNKTTLRQRTEKIQALSVNIDIEKNITPTSILFYGGEMVGNKIFSTGTIKDIQSNATEPTSSRYPDGSSYATSAVYFNYKNNFNDNFTYLAGVRYNLAYLEAQFDTSFFPFPYTEAQLTNHAVNGCLGMVFRINDNNQLNVNLSTGYRTPNIDDVGKVFDSEPGKVIVPNPDLKPEYAYNFDIGFIKTFAENFQFEITSFYTYLQNAMVRSDFTFNNETEIMYDGQLSRVQALTNTDYAQIYGVQAELMVGFLRYFELNTNYTYMSGFDKNKDAIRHVSPPFGSTHLYLKIERFKSDFYVQYNNQIAYNNLAPSERDKPYMYAVDNIGNPYSPSWITYNLKCSYQLLHNLQFNAGIENILDVRYRPYSSGIVAPGRNFIFSLRFRY